MAVWLDGINLLLLGGYGTLRVCAPRFAVGLGAATGVVTLLAGTVGWGVIEFICRGARPAWPFF